MNGISIKKTEPATYPEAVVFEGAELAYSRLRLSCPNTCEHHAFAKCGMLEWLKATAPAPAVMPRRSILGTRQSTHDELIALLANMKGV